MEQQFCQSCGKPLADAYKGTNVDGSRNEDYYLYCYIRANGFSEVWMATSASYRKVKDFQLNKKAGLCYDSFGNSVSMRGIVEVITDLILREAMWQDWFIHHFPGSPNDPDYVLL